MDEGNGFGFEYEIQADDRDTDGISIAANALSLNGATIQDDGGNAADLDLGEHEISNYKVDGSIDNQPAVNDVHIWSKPQEGDTYALGERVGIGLGFNERITVTGTPRLTLTIGTAERTAEYTGVWEDGTGFGFEYVIQADDRDTNGLSIDANALTLNGATIRDSGDNDAVLNLGEYAQAISNDAKHRVDGSIDNPPAVESVCCFSELQSGDTFSLGEKIEIHVHFTEAVTVTGTPQVTLTLSDTETRTMDYDHTFRDTALIFYYEVQSADRSPGGLSVSRDALILNDGTIRDANGNDAELDLGEHGHTAPDPNRKVDGSIDNPPAVVDVHIGQSRRAGRRMLSVKEWT